MTDTVLLEGIAFYGYHGVPAAERALGHRYEVDLALELDLRPAAAADDVTLTVDYGEIGRRVVEIGTGTSMQLIETLAERIAADCLQRYPALTGVTVTVRKLLPPMPVVVRAAAVRIHRPR